MQSNNPSTGSLAHDQALMALSTNIQEEMEKELEKCLVVEKEDYHNVLVPFVQHEKRVREKGKKLAASFGAQLERGQKVLKELFTIDEKKNPDLDSDSTFARWEEAIAKLPKQILTSDPLEEDQSLQKKCGLSNAFMDRAHSLAKTLISDKRYEDACSVFKFLHILNPSIFDYYLGEAEALVELGHYEEANNVYGMSLLLEPNNPYIIYQIGSCLFQLKDFEASQEVFDFCIELCKDTKELEELLTATKNAQELLQSKKAA